MQLLFDNQQLKNIYCLESCNVRLFEISKMKSIKQVLSIYVERLHRMQKAGCSNPRRVTVDMAGKRTLTA